MNLRRFGVLAVMIFLLTIPTVVAFAATGGSFEGGRGGGGDFVPIAPIPSGAGGQNATSGCLGDYINALFKLSLAAGASLAAIYIAIGGFEYIFSEAMESKKDGRLRITHALYGLLILLLVTIILYVIGGQNAVNLNIFTGGCTG